ncbi:MAG TPA: response regulator transcription factor [Candidatus Saccharimonadales bacterium]
MKLLIIEDNQRLAERIKQLLGKNFVVDAVQNGTDGISKATSIDYSVIILDLNLPDMSGDEVCRSLRDAQFDTPILILTGVKEKASLVSLLNCGADDYLTKPFDRGELQARVHALARRQKRHINKNILTHKDLVVDVDRRHVERSGIPIVLRRKEFDILEYLLHNKGRAVTRTMILNHAWETSKDSWSSTVDVHIKYLRDKIDRPFKTPIIKTAYGIGYMVDNA